MTRTIITEFPNYSVDMLGNVYNNETGKKLKPAKINSGYLVVDLYKDHKKYHRLVHRLVADTFLLNIENLTYVDHIDTDKTNNCVSNLRWCTAKENLNNPLTKRHMGNSRTNNPKISTSVKQLSLSGELLKEFPSIKEAYRQTGIDPRSISRCCKGEYKFSGGYKWSY